MCTCVQLSTLSSSAPGNLAATMTDGVVTQDESGLAEVGCPLEPPKPAGKNASLPWLRENTISDQPRRASQWSSITIKESLLK